MTCKLNTTGISYGCLGQASSSGQHYEVRRFTCSSGTQRRQKHVHSQRLVPCHVLEHYLQAEKAEVIEAQSTKLLVSTLAWIAYLAAYVSMPTTLISQADRCEICRNQLPIVKVYTIRSNGELHKNPWPVTRDNSISEAASRCPHEQPVFTRVIAGGVACSRPVSAAMGNSEGTYLSWLMSAWANASDTEPSEQGGSSPVPKLPSGKH